MTGEPQMELPAANDHRTVPGAGRVAVGVGAVVGVAVGAGVACGAQALRSTQASRRAARGAERRWERAGEEGRSMRPVYSGRGIFSPFHSTGIPWSGVQ